MGREAKTKGYRGESEFAKLTKGRRVPLSGNTEGYKHDVILPNGWSVEVKRHKKGLKTLYGWVETNQPDIVAFRADQKQWLVTMTLDKFMELMAKKDNH